MNRIVALIQEHAYIMHVMWRILTTALIAGAIYVALCYLLNVIDKRLPVRFPQTARVLIKKCVWFFGVALVIITVLQAFGFNVISLLSMAGIIGVTVGFAAQTTVSNFISGIFLMVEGTIHIEDQIMSGPVQGAVEDVNIFSVILRTVDGNLVRIPNEYLLKNPTTIIRKSKTKG